MESVQQHQTKNTNEKLKKYKKILLKTFRKFLLPSETKATSQYTKFCNKRETNNIGFYKVNISLSQY